MTRIYFTYEPMVLSQCGFGASLRYFVNFIFPCMRRGALTCSSNIRYIARLPGTWNKSLSPGMHPEFTVSRIKVFDELQRWDSASSCSCPGRRCRRHRSPPPFPRRSGPATQMPEIHGKFVVKIASELTAIPYQSMSSLFDALRVATSSLVPWLEAHRLQTPLQHDIWRPRKKRTATHG